MTRGQIVIVDYRSINPAAGVRPALIIQNDRDNGRMDNTIVAQITTNTRRHALDTQLLIDSTHVDWQQSGLHHPSVIHCSNLNTVECARLVKVVGSGSASTMLKVDECLRRSLGL